MMGAWFCAPEFAFLEFFDIFHSSEPNQLYGA